MIPPTPDKRADEPSLEQAAEKAVLARTPSMEDHLRMESQRKAPARPAPLPRPAPRRRGLLRRLLGR